MARRHKILAALGIAACVAALLLAVFARRIETWARHELVDLYIEKVRPLLPFEIASVRYEASWRDLIQGRVPSLTLELRSRPADRPAWQASLKGPLEVTRRPDRVHLTYDPEVRFEPGDSVAKTHLEVDVNRSASELLAFEARLAAERAAWE
jgi:hypothetical protein